MYLHAYHSRFIPKGVTETSQLFLQETFYETDLAIENTADVTGGKPIDRRLITVHHSIHSPSRYTLAVRY
jgi:hypothetical protein